MSVNLAGLRASFPESVVRPSLMLGLAGLLLWAVGLAFPSQRSMALQGYLVAYLFWLGIGLGSLAALMLHHLVGGSWGFLLRRSMEAAGMTLPVMALLFVPIGLGMRTLYAWSRPGAEAEFKAELKASAESESRATAGPSSSRAPRPGITPRKGEQTDAMLHHKGEINTFKYLTPEWFYVRAVGYFVLWIVLAYFLNRWSLEEDRTGNVRLQTWMARLSGPGLVAYVLSFTFASIDWAMSIEPRWYSTIFSAIMIIGQGLTALALLTAATARLTDRMPLPEIPTPAHFGDLGNLLLAFVMLWAYMSFSQFLIIWSGNLVEEIPWYLHRLRGGWQWVGLCLILFHFFAPFFVLLERATKRRPEVLAKLAIFILAVHVVEVWWVIVPTYRPTFWVSWTDPLAVIGIGGLWLATFAWQLTGKPLLPTHDTRLDEIVEYEREHHHEHPII